MFSRGGVSGQCPPEVTAREAVAAIQDKATVVVVGSGGGVNEPYALLAALEERFLEEASPRELTLYHPNGLGDGHGGGTERFAHEGFVRRVYGSHWTWAPTLARMAAEGLFECAVWPQGILSQLLREAAGRRPGLLSEVGVGTYLDPDTPDQDRPGRQLLPEPHILSGRRWLWYPAPEVDVALIRATSADSAGNLTMEEEGVVLDVLAAASAAKARGGAVLAQVKRRKAEHADPRQVRVPGCLVDAVIVEPIQRQSAGTAYQAAFSGDAVKAVPRTLPNQLVRRVIAARAAQELAPGMLVNVGFGIADAVPLVAEASGFGASVTFSLEQGAMGGIPASGDDFGLMWNPTAILDAPAVFDLYDGGGLDLALVSFAQVDQRGNVNVSYFGGRLVGPGGFMNITRGARAVVFCGTMTTGDLRVDIGDGRLVIVNEGAVRKFVSRCDQITFSAEEARLRGQRVLYVTERGVFTLGRDGIELVEVARGLDAERDIVAAMGFRPRISPELHQVTSDAVCPTLPRMVEQ